MKNLRTISLCVCISLVSLTAVSQNDVPSLNQTDYNKPKLFQAFPEQIIMDAAVVNNILAGSVGTPVDLNIAEGTSFRFAGNIVSASVKNNDKLISVVVRSTNFNGAILAISKIIHDNGTVSYKGRIISRTHDDVYELQDLNGRFVFVKRKYHEIINE